MFPALLIVSLTTLAVGWFLGVQTRRYTWPRCPGTDCWRLLRCPVCEAADIRQDQAAAGPVAQWVR